MILRQKGLNKIQNFATNKICLTSGAKTECLPTLDLISKGNIICHQIKDI